jgi:UDP-N-acetylglucosamine 1-carboxyvinyltransferase
MDRIVIRGGKPLRGEVRISGAKNAALAEMAACMLATGESTLDNVPRLQDIDTMAGMLDFLGARTRREGDRLRIDASDWRGDEAPYDMVRKMRASFYVMGPMLGRLRRAKVSHPGGCAIGPRPIDLHLRGFEALGAKITVEHGYVLAEGEGMRGAEFSLEGEFGTSVGATCNVAMAAALTPGTTVIHGAALEPEVAEVVRMLNLMGAKIKGLETSTLEIEGVERLHPIHYATIPDRIEAGTFLVGAVITGGDVLALGAKAEHMEAVLDKLRQVGAEVEVRADGVRVKAGREIRATTIRTLPYPGFPTDMQAQFMAMLCLARGESLIQEGIYPDRFIHAAELMRMGADIHHGTGEARVRGVGRLQGAPLMASDLRASAALVLAGLAAEGETVIHRVYHIDRAMSTSRRRCRRSERTSNAYRAGRAS